MNPASQIRKFVRSGTHRLLCRQRNGVEIYGSEGTLTCNFATDEIRLGKQGGEMQTIPIPGSEAKEWTVERDFINAVLNPSAPRPTPDFLEGIKYMRDVQAAAESMEGGMAISVC